MIMTGNQIFSHLEGEVSLPASLYELAKLHSAMSKEHKEKCKLCQGLFANLPKGFNKQEVFYDREIVTVSLEHLSDPRERPPGFRDELIEKIKAQRAARNQDKKKPKQVKRTRSKVNHNFQIKLK